MDKTNAKPIMRLSEGKRERKERWDKGQRKMEIK